MTMSHQRDLAALSNPSAEDSPPGRFRQLKRYVGWSDQDAALIQSVAQELEPAFAAIVLDFYAQIDQTPRLRSLITGGDAQLVRLKATLHRWISALFSGRYDDDYAQNRWRVGTRHAEIGLDQVFCTAALCRIRAQLSDAVFRLKNRDPALLQATARALNKLLDLELALIDDAYQTERLARQQRIERLATLGQIAGGLAHELRNPLNVIQTSVYFLLHAHEPSAEKIAEHLQRIERQVELTDGVIGALTSFAGLPRPDPRPFEIDACIREVLAQTPLPPSIETTLECLDGLPAVAADAKQLQIVLRNLIRNAGEAMPAAGRLTIAGRAEGNMVEIAVRDTGPGIPADQLARIMEPFFTTKTRGLGLGLAISRSIVEKNQGELLVRSQPGQGSTFLLRLRAAAPTQGNASLLA